MSNNDNGLTVLVAAVRLMIIFLISLYKQVFKLNYQIFKIKNVMGCCDFKKGCIINTQMHTRSALCSAQSKQRLSPKQV